MKEKIIIFALSIIVICNLFFNIHQSIEFDKYKDKYNDCNQSYTAVVEELESLKIQNETLLNDNEEKNSQITILQQEKDKLKKENQTLKKK